MRGGTRFVIAIVIALVGVVSYFSSSQQNPVTGEKQYVKFSPKQEVALGIEMAPVMTREMGGLHADKTVQQYVNIVGQEIVRNSTAQKSSYQFQFHVLADRNTVNAFALPGGQIFITAGLLRRLKNESQLAGVLGHEIGHVIARHSAEHMAKGQLTQFLVTAAGVAGSDPESMGSGQRSAMIASMVGQLTTLKYGRSDELESDRLGVHFMSEAGYNPNQLIDVMNILESASGSRGQSLEWLQTHPNPGNRREIIKQEIASVKGGSYSAPADNERFRQVLNRL